MEQIILYILAGVAAGCTLLLLFVRQIFYAALALLGCLLALAGIYAVLEAGFVAITQILIYAGGVLVLIVFAIVVTNRISGKPLVTESHHKLSGFIVSGLMAAILVLGYSQTDFNLIAQPENSKALNTFSISLFTRYAAPFEIAGILLLVSLIGASLTASSFKKGSDD